MSLVHCELSRVANNEEIRIVPPFEAWLIRCKYSLSRDKVVGGAVLAMGVREGSEAEARRVVGSLTLSQIAIVHSLCGLPLESRSINA